MRVTVQEGACEALRQQLRRLEESQADLQAALDTTRRELEASQGLAAARDAETQALSKEVGTA